MRRAAVGEGRGQQCEMAYLNHDKQELGDSEAHNVLTCYLVILSPPHERNREGNWQVEIWNICVG